MAEHGMECNGRDAGAGRERLSWVIMKPVSLIFCTVLCF